MQFTAIDLQNWPRGQMFYYFSQMAPTGYSLTVKMDVTKLYETVKKEGMKFFPVYLWLVTKNLNRQVEFKIAKQEDTLGYYDTLTPLYAAFHEDDHTFSLMWTPFTGNIRDFYQNYLQNQEKYGAVHGVLSQPQTPPPANAYTVSSVPWIDFEHFAIHSDTKSYFFPSVEAGKYVKEDGHLIMPLSITCHHATTDGYHVKTFLEDLQQDMDDFEKYLISM